MIVNKTGVDSFHFVRTNRSTNAAAADRHATIQLSRGDPISERDNKVRIIVVGIQHMRTEVDDLVPGRADAGDQFLLQSKSTVIRGNSDAHKSPLAIFPQRPGRRSPMLGAAAHGRQGSTDQRRAAEVTW